jgi:hypothetical protein
MLQDVYLLFVNYFGFNIRISGEHIFSKCVLHCSAHSLALMLIYCRYKPTVAKLLTLPIIGNFRHIL